MGREAECEARFSWIGRGKRVVGRAQLETDAVTFRAEGVRVALARATIDGVRAQAGVLHIAAPEGTCELHLGHEAAKWEKALVAPPSLLDKLGVKAGARVAVLGDVDEAFLDELAERAADVAPAVPDAETDLAFLVVGTSRELAAIAKLRARLRDDAHLWVVYPKGKPDPSEAQVREAGRAAGLKDTKVARFDDARTALRFTVPVAARARRR